MSSGDTMTLKFDLWTWQILNHDIGLKDVLAPNVYYDS